MTDAGAIEMDLAASDLDRMMHALSASREYRVLRRYSHQGRYHEDDGTEKLLGLYLDVETTGLQQGVDRIIELALVPFEFSRDGRIFAVLGGIDEFEDPGLSIPPEITALTGITDDDVRGRRIDDGKVEELVSSAMLVVAHNASFDRRFVDRRFPSFQKAAWACTCNQVNWKLEGIESHKLDYLACQFGFFYDKHRALNDCLAAIHILAQRLPRSGELALKVLLETARKRTIRLWAINSPFESKDILKSRGYTWPGNSGRHRAWFIDIEEGRVMAEQEFLWREIYGRRVSLPTTSIDCYSRFSDRV